jgi:2-dehydropantoate 2-reductase
MRVAVVGTGGVGAYFGGRLARAGTDVVFLARGAHLRAIQESGLRVDSVDGDFVVYPAQATDTAIAVGPVDVVLLTVKGWQVAEAIETIRSLIGPETVVVPLLNGIEAPDQLAAALGAEHAAGGLCGLFGTLVGPGHVRNLLPQPFVTFGELDATHSGRLERLQQAFAQAGVQAAVTNDIRAALWEKLMFVGPFGGVGAVTRAPVGVMRSLPETRALLEGAMREIAHVAHTRGVNVTPDAVTRSLVRIDGSPAQATASMQRDLMSGRRSELESQIGVVVRFASDGGLEVPRHTYIYASLLPQEAQARGEIIFPA